MAVSGAVSFQLLMVTGLLVVHCQAEECSTSDPSTVRFSGRSYRNSTGHWLAEIVVIHNTTAENRDLQSEQLPWTYDVDFKRHKYEKYESLQTVIKFTGAPVWSPEGYTHFPDVGYYKVYTEQMDWGHARNACAQEGTHLAIINSAAEETVLKEIMIPYKQNQPFVWVGFSYGDTAGQMVTVLGEPLSSTGYVRWAPGEPQNSGCGCMATETGLLADAYCTGHGYFICEHSL